jgi:uncharacterized protein YidB (DUF937 family)
MGLLDVLKGMQNGPRGQQSPNASGGGMSPITMAVLGLLAYKALKSFTGQPDANPAAPSTANPAGGGLGNILSGGLGGLLAGGAAGSILSGGLGDLLKQFQQGGLGDAAKSWVGTGPNQPVSPDELSKALGADQIRMLMEHSGLSRDELLAGLSQHLPHVIDQMTPNGRVPTEQEVSRSL